MYLDQTQLEQVLQKIKKREEQESLLELLSLLAVNDVDKNSDKILELLRIYRRSKVSKYIIFDLTQKKEAFFLGRVNNWKIDEKRNAIVLDLGPGLKPIVKLGTFKGKDIEEIAGILSQLLFLVIRREEKVVKGQKKAKRIVRDVVKELIVHYVKSDIETAKKLLEKEHPIKLLVDILGYIPDVYPTFRVSLPRIIAFFKIPINPHYTSAIHLMQLTTPATGKTTTVLRLMNILNIGYISGGLPTPAKLIYHSAKNAFGMVYTKDYIVLDEFEKSLSNKQKAVEFISTLQSGLAKGVWVRETHTPEQLQEIRRDVAFLFFGNIEGKVLKEVGNYREYIRRILKEKLEEEGIVNTFLERIAITDLYAGQSIIPFTHKKIYPAPIVKGVFEYLNDVAGTVDTKNKDFGLSSRHEFQAKQIYKVLRALGVNESLAEDLAKYIVIGDRNVESYYKELFKEITGKEPEEIIEL